MINDEEKALIAKLGKFWLEGAKFREKFSVDWVRAADIVRGKMWPERRPKYKINAVMNFLGQIIEKKAALLTDSRPTISVVSRKQGTADICEMLKYTIEAILEERNFEQRLTEAVILAEHFGLVGMNTAWDKDLDWGNGDIDIVTLDPRCFVLDPFVLKSWNLNSGEYFALETIRPTEYLRNKYPDKADDIKADLSSDQQIRDDSLVGKLRRTFMDFFSDKSGDTRKDSVVPRSIVRQFWWRDREKRDGVIIHPNWRVSIIAGGCIVEDGNNPYIDGNISFDVLEWDYNVDSIYGLNEVNKLEMPQILFNKVLATIVENAILTGNAQWIGEVNAMAPEEWDRLGNEPGAHVKVRPGTQLFKREAGPQLPTYIEKIPGMLLQGLEKLSSITEATEGRKPGSVTSGAAIENLQIAAQTAIRLKARQIEGLLTRVGQKLISRIFQHYTEDRLFNLLGNQGAFKQYQFEREKIRALIRGAGNEVGKVLQDYQFKVVPASSLTMTKWQKGMVAMQLLQMKAIDRKELLDVLEWPNREDILARVKEEEQQQAAMGQSIHQPTRQKLPKQLLGAGGSRQGGAAAIQRPIQ